MLRKWGKDMRRMITMAEEPCEHGYTVRTVNSNELKLWGLPSLVSNGQQVFLQEVRQVMQDTANSPLSRTFHFTSPCLHLLFRNCLLIHCDKPICRIYFALKCKAHYSKYKHEMQLGKTAYSKQKQTTIHGVRVHVKGWELDLNLQKSNFHYVRFEVFTAVTMKNGVFWVVTPCGSCYVIGIIYKPQARANKFIQKIQLIIF
jgi:hypothetical protein